MRVSGIWKSYDAASAAVAGVDLDVAAGELLALLGPSGSGKTTLLRTIAGLEIPDAGRIHFGARDVTDTPVQDRQIGFVFQHYALFRHLSVADNVAYGLRALRRDRMSDAAIRTRVANLLELVQLDGLAGRFPAQLSGGQRQRVALARSLATSPRVLLLDEPFGALDARVRKDLRRWLRDIHRETRQTTIFVTHDQDEALELADRVAILNQGHLEQVGTPEDVHDRPISAIVAGFVGDRVRLPVRIEDGIVRSGATALSISSDGRPDGDAELHVRPDEIALGELGDGIPAMVREVRRVGPRRVADIEVSGSRIDVILPPRSATPSAGDAASIVVYGGLIFAPRF